MGHEREAKADWSSRCYRSTYLTLPEQSSNVCAKSLGAA
jgi:hypothetical protein